MINLMRCRRSASIKKLMQIKDVTEKEAKKIKQVWRTVGNRKNAREMIDKILQTYGVEYLGQNKRNSEHVYYCNTGDTYATTIIFIGFNLIVACWGDLVERNLIHERS
jgi:hypothetical protein